MEKKQTLVVPDVHGRTFWRNAVSKYKDQVEFIVFLGDYLDPYPSEASPVEAWEEFQDIVKLKKLMPEKVILLEGNHDAHYHYLETFEEYGRSPRFDWSCARKYEKFFNQNQDLFQAAFKWGDILFTHAGVSLGWIGQNKLLLPQLKDIDWWLNNMLKTCPMSSLNYLGDMEVRRGGWCKSGSPLWADWEERDEFLKDLYQVVGHTWSGEARITDYAACLDCEKVFLIGEDRKIKEAT